MTMQTATAPEELLRQARADDRTAFGLLLESCRGYLTLLARVQIGRRLQGKVDAADVVQETFLAAHRDFARFRGTTEKEFAVWLRQILACRLSDLMRRYCGTRGRDVRLERQLADALDSSSQALCLVASQSTPSQQLCRREQAVVLADALGRLPPDYSEVIVLRHLEGLRFPEIARRMGRSADSVEKLWVRGLARLRRELGVSP
ncbi:MAG TPA: sigma-70 family RNA polymerase sigma factor [Gemmataceae bacterium]|nr:sigma-70 family RNA polymerase sigma factor [Gemmataceae bacterium]